MVVGLAGVVIGVVAIVSGARITRSYIVARFGDVNELTIGASEGTGVVPKWVSAVVLLGWLTSALGVVIGLISMLA